MLQLMQRKMWRIKHVILNIVYTEDKSVVFVSGPCQLTG